MKKIFVLMLAVLMLVGCGSNKTENTENETTKVLKVGMECDYAPFNWSSTTASEFAKPISSVDYCDGYDVVIATKIAEALGMEVQIVKTEWDGLIPSLNAGDIDLIVAGMTDTAERRESVDFTEPYYISDIVMIVRGDDELANATDLADFSGHAVMGQLNTLYDEYIDQIDGVTHSVGQATYPGMIVALQQKETDALTAELPVALQMVAANPDLAIVQFAEGHGFNTDMDNDGVNDASVSIAVKKDRTDLLEQVGAALAKISVDERNQIMSDAQSRGE